MVKTPAPNEFEQLLNACDEISNMFPKGIVYIGGIAVYLHAINHPATREFAEFTHDADFYISMADMSDLRDVEELTTNRRLTKHQLVKRGFEFDVYTEHHSALVVPYSAVMAHAVKYENLRVAGLEHLFVLKLEAYRDRYASSKGQKDAKDLIRLAAVAQSRPFDPAVVAPYLGSEHIALLVRVERGPEALSMARGNAMIAKRFRQYFSRIAKQLTSAA